MSGVTLALIIGIHSADFTSGLLPFTAGCFVYMSCADLMPSLLTDRAARTSTSAIVLIGVGILMMAALLFLDPSQRENMSRG